MKYSYLRFACSSHLSLCYGQFYQQQSVLWNTLALFQETLFWNFVSKVAYSLCIFSFIFLISSILSIYPRVNVTEGGSRLISQWHHSYCLLKAFLFHGRLSPSPVLKSKAPFCLTSLVHRKNIFFKQCDLAPPTGYTLLLSVLTSQPSRSQASDKWSHKADWGPPKSSCWTQWNKVRCSG